MLEPYKYVKEKLSDFNLQYAIHLLDSISEHPVTSFKSIKTKINTNSYQPIYNLLDKFQEEKILVEITGGKRNKIYVFDELMKIIR